MPKRIHRPPCFGELWSPARLRAIYGLRRLANRGDWLPHGGPGSQRVHRKLFEIDPSTKRLTVLRSALQMQTPEQMPFSTQSYFEELIPAGTGVAGTAGLLACGGVGRCT